MMAVQFASRLVVAVVVVLCCALGATYNGFATAAVTEETSKQDTTKKNDVQKLHQELTEWLNSSPGGYFNPKQEIRLVKTMDGQTANDDDDDSHSFYGVFAKEFIAKGEVLNQVPWEYIISDEEEDESLKEQDDEDGSLRCGTTRNLAREMKNAETSKYGPYVRYLLSQPRGVLPSAWSKKGKEMLDEVLGQPNQKIPPKEPSTWLDEDWLESCNGDPKDELGAHAAMQVIARADDDLLVPIYDMYNHRNGPWYNTHMKLVRGEYHQVTARKDIQPGEQIHNSYNMCDECGGRSGGYGTPEIFRDYGFVEEFPQRWDLDDLGVMFDLLKTENGTIELSWEEGHKPDKDEKGESDATVRNLRKELKRLYKVRSVLWKNEWKDGKPSIPQNEWNSLWEYHEAVVTAISYAINDLTDDENEKVPVTGTDSVCTVESCGGDYFDTLDYEDDDFPYNKPTCSNREILTFPDYLLLEQLKTTYQIMNYAYRESDGDICMDLDDTLQICSCYRPHYHEFSAHFAARFIETVKRVIFIGGGDSMLLHESLKYPSLEKVVGLELDQTVTRKAFKYFRTQPHFDDERVEWWFGDATKSLLLLPEDYWGSFDLVLVDLSETVMAFSVTDDLDVFDALALLLNEGGVMVKNELYMNDMSKTFDYTLQIHLDENPKICSQCMAFGSNRADFFHQPIKDQNVTTLLLPPVAELKDRFDFFHDYRKNNAKKAGKCDLSSRKEEENDEQGKSAGILHVLDAENVTITLDSSSVEKMILEVGKEEGLTPVSISTNRPDGIVSEMVVVVFKEGYVLARLWPEYSYCAIDIGLWGGFLREASFHKRLAKAMNPKTLSSFRVIVGGMYGSSTWREDKKVIGPQLVQHRDCDVPEPKDVEFSDDAAKRVTVNEITNLAASSKIVAAVICGVKDKDDCISVDVLDKNPKVAKLVPIWTCPDLLDEAEGPQTLMRKFECEENTISAIQESLGPDERFDIVILDASTPLVMGQIMNSILSVRRYQSELLNDYNIFFAWSNKPKTESWQRNFLERYRKDIKYDPITRVEMQITVDDETMEVGLVSCGDLAVFYNVNVLEKKLNKRLQREGTSAKAEVVNLTGGMFRYQHDYNPREFLHSDYDSEPGDKQYAEQKPIGREMILQLELNDEMDNAEMPSWESMTHMVQALFAAMKYEVTRSESYTNIGDGALLVTAFKEGNAVLVWDGRNHIDVNLFLFDDRKELADTFASKLTHFTENNLKVALRDDFPRGFGRVVNFKDDLGFTYDSVPRRPYVE